MSEAPAGEVPQSNKTPLWRVIFDQGHVMQEVIDHKYVGAGTEDDPFQVNWLENDPRNPLAFSSAFRWYLMLLVGVDTFAVSLVSSAYSGSVVEVIEEFHISEEVALLGISLFVLGFAVGPLIWAPLSEVYGRRIIISINLVGLTAFTAGAAGSMNPWTLFILRFFGGATGSGPFAISSGVLADTFPAITRGFANGFYCAAPFLGPVIGPLAGGFLSESAGWRWVEGLGAVFSGLCKSSSRLHGSTQANAPEGLLINIFTLPETNPGVLLKKRADQLSILTGKVYRSKVEIEQSKKSLATILKISLSRPWDLLLREPIVLFLTLYLSIIYGILYLLFAAYPIVYQKTRGWSEGTSGLAFIGILVGIVFATIATYPMYISYRNKTLASPGRLSPEARLPDSFYGAIALPVGLFWFAWTNYPSVHWMASIAAGVPFGFGMMMVFLPVLNYLVDAYTIYAASAVAANSSVRSVFAAAFPLFAEPMYENLGIHWASSIIAFLALACVPLPFFFYKYGPAIRTRCHYSAESERLMEALFGAAAQKQVKMKESSGQGEGDDDSPGNKNALRADNDKAGETTLA